MNHRFLGICFIACLLRPSASSDPRPADLLLVANQMEHSALLVDPMSKRVLATVGVDINGHEAVSPDDRFGYVPIYGNTWVGKSGSNGSTIHVVDLRRGKTVAIIDLGKEVRPHCAHFGPDGLLYVSAELSPCLSWTSRGPGSARQRISCDAVRLALKYRSGHRSGLHDDQFVRSTLGSPLETAYPSTFILDRNRTILFEKVSHGHRDRLSAQDALAQLATK